MIHPPLPGDLGKGSFLETQVMLLEPGYYEIEFHDGRRVLLQVTADNPRYALMMGRLGTFGLDPNDENSEWDKVQSLHLLGVVRYNLPIPQPSRETR